MIFFHYLAFYCHVHIISLLRKLFFDWTDVLITVAWKPCYPGGWPVALLCCSIYTSLNHCHAYNHGPLRYYYHNNSKQALVYANHTWVKVFCLPDWRNPKPALAYYHEFSPCPPVYETQRCSATVPSPKPGELWHRRLDPDRFAMQHSPEQVIGFIKWVYITMSVPRHPSSCGG